MRRAGFTNQNLEGLFLKSIQMKLTLIILVIFIGALGTLAGLNYWKAREIITQNVISEMEKQAVQKQAETLKQLNADRKKLGQEDSDIQQKLDMLKEFSIKKNQALAEAINPHFKHFQFQFLDYTQDGEPVEVCKMICDGIGYFDGLNHSDQILCNIDLVTGLQELNGLNLPIWVDDVESVNADRIPDTGRQMILLKVSDDELKVEGI